MHTRLCSGQRRSPVLGVEALMFPFAALRKIVFRARGYTLLTTVPCRSKYAESSVQMKARTSQASSCFPSALLSAASGPGGREGLRCLTCPRALACRHRPAPCLCQQALASAQCQALQRLPDQGKVTSPHVPTGQRTKPALKSR